MIRVLHLTPHLGGGVGKALSGLVGMAARSGSKFEHEILCLERPEKSQFVERVQNCGCKLRFCPSQAELREAIEDADIVQLEFWNHPATLHALCSEPLPAMRLVVWCHVSGLQYPRIPPRLLTEAQKFLFTSGCSFESAEVRGLPTHLTANLAVVSSGGGLDALPPPPTITRKGGLSIGYMGSLNFAKLHPDFVSFLAAIRTPELRVRLIGDETNRVVLEEQCRRLGRPNLLEFRGYANDVATELAALDVLVYLLNPEHYGTAENALLEAMAMGVIPVVLDNLAEQHIVEDRRTGLVVRNPGELAEALDWLNTHSEERLAMAQRAAATVRERYTYERMEKEFNGHYEELMGKPKRIVPFGMVFGDSPADWFRAFHRDPSIFGDNGEVHISVDKPCHTLFERTKGSVFHFLDYFPNDIRLQNWATALSNQALNYIPICDLVMKVCNAVMFSHPPSFPEARDLLLRIMATESNHFPRTVDRPLALYGAGDLGRMAREYFALLGIPVAFVVDIKAEQIQSDPFWAGLKIISPGDVDQKTREGVLLAVCVVTSPYAELAQGLTSAGWANITPFYDIAEAYRDQHPLSNGWFAAPFSSSDAKNIETVLEGWADDVSRAHHLQFIAWRRLREEWIFSGAPVTANNRFFIPEVLAVLTDHEAFADLGAHIGKVSSRFIEVVGSRFREIWAVEPDSESFSSLTRMFKKLSEAAKVKLIPVVLGSKRGKQNFFSGLGYASQCSDLSQHNLEIETVDALGLSPSFMKLHLEGAELEVLKGARKTIHQYRPIIAVTSYHNPDGLWALPQWLMRELANYKFYMRLHSWCGTGGVIYCIPTERLDSERKNHDNQA